MLFDDNYEVFLANTETGKKLHYHLRYKVYCEETGWEQPLVFPEYRVECDEYDAFSQHLLVRHRASGDWVAGMRLVENPLAKLHISKFCYPEVLKNDLYKKNRCVEVSRLFVLPEFRVAQAACGGGGRTDERRSSLSAGIRFELTLGLIRAAAEYGRDRNIHGGYFFVEPVLARGLRRAGLDLYPCGPAVDFRGVRAPFYSDMETCFTRLSDRAAEIDFLFHKEGSYRLLSLLERELDDAGRLRLLGKASAKLGGGRLAESESLF